MHNSSTTSAAKQNFRQLSVIRIIAIAGQLIALLIFSQIKDIGLPVFTISMVLALYGLIITLSWWRSFLKPEITKLEFFYHLLIDILFFTILLYFSGGASNPFVSYYLVPISIAATTLPLQYTWGIVLLSLASYSGLLINYLPIPELTPGASHEIKNNLHVWGMWCNFALSAILITYFVTRMAYTLKQQETKLAQQREDQLRDEQVIGIGTLAAGTAHELGTPLSTMKILVDEMQAEHPSLNKDFSILQQQIEQCRITLKQLIATAEAASNNMEIKPIREYFDKILERWQIMRPKTNININYLDDLPECTTCFHPTIAQALTNLLNNAADASPNQIDIQLKWSTTMVELNIRDYGAGITTTQLEVLGKPFNSNKPHGMGLGLFLTQASINRYGGEVTIQANNNQQGTLTRVLLPLIQQP